MELFSCCGIYVFSRISLLQSIRLRPRAVFIGLAIGYQYAYYFPYLRWLAIHEERSELDTATSIILGLVLSFTCIIPSLIFEAIIIDD